ncbi:MAG TPA: lamin tail domain-containing protein, partial [Thermoplasmata archaeon]|nr:lamin tail domain-containing protein [Thermoplasmata archaeon]
MHALRADEYVVLANVAGAPLDLSGWSITDGEGVLGFPPGSIAATGARIVVAQNSTAYFEDTLAPADFRYLAGNATPMAVSGTFQLNNAGDEVILRDASAVTVDVFAYGSSTYAGPGWTGTPAAVQDTGYVARRDFVASWRDTDSSTDWDLLRVRSLGQSEFTPAAYDVTGTALAFVTPDAKTWPLRELLANATSSVDLCVYTISNSDLVDGLNEATARGVRVRVLLEGAPVG